MGLAQLHSNPHPLLQKCINTYLSLCILEREGFSGFNLPKVSIFGNEFAISFAIFEKLTIGKASADARCKIHHFWTKIKVRGTFRFENHGNQNVFVFLNLISLGLLKPIIYLFYTTRSLLFVDAFELLLTL